MAFRMILGALFIFLSGCSTIHVQNDYNPKYDFSRLRTFSILYDHSSAGSSLNQDRIAKALKRELEAKGYIETEKKFADFYIVFHTNVKNKTKIVTDYERVGLRSYRYWAEPRVPVQRQYDYKEGKIIVDALDPKTKQVFWRGTATDMLQSFNTPAERIEYINKVAKEVMSAFPAMKGANNARTPTGSPSSPFDRP